MLKGVNLTLMIGPAVPIPVPAVVLNALESLTVTTASGETQSGFDLKFSLSNKSPLHTIFLLAGGSMPPILRTVIVVTMNGSSEVLIDGVVTKVDVMPGNEGGHSVLSVTGKDLTAVMDVIDFTGLPYPALPVYARVNLILLKYAALGVVPLVIPPIVTDLPLPTERIDRHQGNDLAYVRQLAHESGYVFYHDPGPIPGMSKAYWGPEIKVGVPQKALNIDMDAHTNVESLSFSFNKEMKEMPIVFFPEEKTKLPLFIPIPDISPLNPPLGLIPPLPLKIRYLDDVVYANPLRAVMAGMAQASRTSDCVTGTGTLNVLRYGSVLKARQLVGVRGAGPAFDGLYFVSSVTNTIKRGEFKQSFELKRNGLVSTVPRVPA